MDESERVEAPNVARTYRQYPTASFFVTQRLVPAFVFFTAVVAAGNVFGATSWSSAAIYLIWTIGALLVSFRTFSAPDEIEELTGGEFVFRRPIGKELKMSAKSVRAISPGFQLGTVRLTHEGGTLVFSNQFDGFHDFLASIKRQNPRVEIRGL